MMGLCRRVWRVKGLAHAASPSLWTDAKNTNPTALTFVDDLTVGPIKCVLSDMDGTLLLPDHGLSPQSISAIQRLQKAGILFFPATGRTRKSMADAAGKDLIALLGGDLHRIPGVYSQGLVVYGPTGELIYEETLADSVIELIEDYCDKQTLSVIAYAGDRILTYKQTYHTRKIVDYMEPVPDELGLRLSKLRSKGIIPNKLILLDDDEVLRKHRPSLEALLKGKASLTRAVPGMLEVLPYGASKGNGVKKLLEHCQINPEECIAFGDGENDIEMLQLVKYGIAMENARDELKEASDAVTWSNSQHGVAYALTKLLKI